MAFPPSASTSSQKSLAPAPDLTGGPGGSGLPWEGRGAGGGLELATSLPSPSPPVPQGTHQAARHRTCRRAKLTPKDVAIAGTFLAETIFATCHTLRLFTLPGSPDALRRVRGEGRGSRRRAHTRAHTRPRSASPSRGGRVCARGPGGGGTCLPSPPPFLAELALSMESYIYRSTPFRARTPKLPGLTVVRFHRQAEQVLSDL